MIKIAKLTLKNFKSFRKAEVPFAEGFTCIVGSNASGKSNILDAIMFVFGSTSLKTLRAAKLVDLVNHDASEDYAKVEIDLKGDDKNYKITRMIDRQGRSVFKLDEKKLTLDEIRSLLTELGITASGHNIVAQGDVTRIVEMNPKQRREIIEGVAGLQEFEEKKDEAVSKLEKVEQRVKDAGIVLKEREAYLDELEKEKKSAEKFLELQNELQRSKATIISKELNRIKAAVETGKTRKSHFEKQVDENVREKNGVMEEIKENEKKLEETKEKLHKAREAVYSTIGKSVEEKKSELRIARERLQDKERNSAEMKVKKGSLAEKIRHIETHIVEKKSELKELDEKLGKISAELSKLENAGGKKNESLREKIAKAVKLIEKAEALVEKIRAKKADSLPELEKLLGELKSEFSEIENDMNESAGGADSRAMLSKLRAENSEIAGRLAKNSAEIEAAEKRKPELEVEIAEIGNNLEIAQNEIADYNKKIKELEKDLEQKQDEFEKASKSNVVLEEESRAMSSKIDKLIDKRRTAEDKVERIRKEMNELLIELSKNEVRFEDLAQEFLNYRDVKVFENANVPEIEKRIPKIEQEITELGAINMRALQGFEDYRKEVLDIREKCAKLDEERRAIVEMIDKIEVKKLTVFMDCFNNINANFRKLYFEFFKGEGRLGLTDQTNPLEGGLTIEAKYKEDKLKSIDAMSGGEKSLTALAFLFAIQTYEPDPFYIFDEADAALDRENSFKLGGMIKGISGNSQFIAITHNDTLMKQADQLIGVALNKQKSSVIGLKLKEKITSGAKKVSELDEDDLENGNGNSNGNSS